MFFSTSTHGFVTPLGVKLVNGTSQCSGRVEVLNDGLWGTVCDAGWDLTDASVVCKDMGCSTPKAVTTDAFFGEGTGLVWMEDVKCTGSESSVRICPTKAFGTSTCSHAKDAGVICNRERKVY